MVGEYESFKKNRPNFYFDFGGYEPKFRETFVKEIAQALKFQKKIVAIIAVNRRDLQHTCQHSHTVSSG